MSHKSLVVFVLAQALSFAAQPAIAEDSSSVHGGEWPIENGVKHQPTRGELGGGREFTQDQAGEVDRLYDELLSSGNKGEDHSRPKRGR
jgi:hypothetical protein